MRILAKAVIILPDEEHFSWSARRLRRLVSRRAEIATTFR